MQNYKGTYAQVTYCGSICNNKRLEITQKSMNRELINKLRHINIMNSDGAVKGNDTYTLIDGDLQDIVF